MIMIDIETLGVKPGSVILSIGAVEFTVDEIGTEFYTRVDFDQPGMEMDPNTVAWWMTQDTLPRVEAFSKAVNRPSLVVALDMLRQTFQWDQTVWSHGSIFDIAHLDEAYRREGKRSPWDFRLVRDTRTLFSLYPNISVPRHGTAHSALDDAINQAKWVQACMKERGLTVYAER